MKKRLVFIIIGICLYPIIFKVLNHISFNYFNYYVGYIGLGL